MKRCSEKAGNLTATTFRPYDQYMPLGLHSTAGGLGRRAMAAAVEATASINHLDGFLAVIPLRKSVCNRDAVDGDLPSTRTTSARA